jgi:cytochrome c-type biogenesis protein CcmH
MFKFNFLHAIVILFLFNNISLIYAVEPEEIMKDPQLESRARNISKNVRCLVCQNQSIDDSSAHIAKDLRILIREKIKNGKTDKEIYSFLTTRYGDFILLKPPFKYNTILLWLTPFILFLLGFLILFGKKK